MCKVKLERKYLSEEERAIIHNVLSKYYFLFGETLVICRNIPVYLELQPYYNIYYTKLYPVKRAHESIFKREF